MITRNRKQKYPPPKVIAVDVDGTLIIRGIINEKLVKWCKQKKEDGFQMILWSSRGQNHAEKAAEITELIETFDIIISKPGYIVDDQGWGWIKFTRVITRLDA